MTRKRFAELCEKAEKEKSLRDIPYLIEILNAQSDGDADDIVNMIHTVGEMRNIIKDFIDDEIVCWDLLKIIQSSKAEFFVFDISMGNCTNPVPLRDIQDVFNEFADSFDNF